MTLTQANLVSQESLTPNVFKIILKPQEPVEFKAGQYLQVVMGENDKRPFSIANMPANSEHIELHIGATPDNPYAYEVLQRLESENALNVEVGLGIAFRQSSELDAILIAGGTGYSYTKSILMDMLQNEPARKVTLYWGAKSMNDLYEAQALNKLSELHPNFSFKAVVETLAPDNTHADAGIGIGIGMVHQVAMQEVKDFSNKQVYVAGRFEMAKVVKDDLLPLGLKSENLIGDAFAFI